MTWTREQVVGDLDIHRREWEEKGINIQEAILFLIAERLEEIANRLESLEKLAER